MQIEHNPVRPHANFRLKMKTGILHTRQHKSVEITRGNKVGYIGRGSEAVKSLSDFVNGILINMFTSYRGARREGKSLKHDLPLRVVFCTYSMFENSAGLFEINRSGKRTNLPLNL